MDSEIRGVLRVQETEDGRKLKMLFSETGELLMTSWESAPQKQRKGKSSRYCIGSRFDELTTGQKIALLNIRNQIMIDGRIKSRRRTKNGRREELITLLGSKYMLAELQAAEALVFDNDRYFVSKKFLFRG